MDSDRQPLVSHQGGYHDEQFEPLDNPYDPPSDIPPNGPFVDRNTPLPYPGPSQPYAQAYYPPQPAGFEKSSSAGERFKPKNGVRDPFFLVLFLVQVCPRSRWACVMHVLMHLQLAGLVGISAFSVYSWFNRGGPRFDEDSNKLEEDIGAIASKYVLLDVPRTSIH